MRVQHRIGGIRAFGGFVRLAAVAVSLQPCDWTSHLKLQNMNRKSTVKRAKCQLHYDLPGLASFQARSHGPSSEIRYYRPLVTSLTG